MVACSNYLEHDFLTAFREDMTWVLQQKWEQFARIKIGSLKILSLDRISEPQQLILSKVEVL